MRPPFSERLSAGPDVLIRPIGDESVLLNVKTETYFGLDAVGTRFWTVLVGAASIEDGLRTLLDEYDVAAGDLRSDLADFVDELIRRELVTVVQPAADQASVECGASDA